MSARKAPGTLGDRNSEARLTVFAERRTLGDIAQLIEIHVGPGCDRDQRPALLLASLPRLQAGERQSARRLENRARIDEDVLDRCANLVVVDAHDAVEILPAQLEAIGADLTHRHAVAKAADVRQPHRRTALERLIHAVGVARLHTENPDLRLHALDVRANAGGQPSSADRHENRIELGRLLENFHPDGPLAGNHVRMIERRHEGAVALARIGQRGIAGIVEIVAVQHDLGAIAGDGLDLDVGCGVRHEHARAAPERVCRERHALRMIAGGGRHHPAGERLRGQPRHQRIGAPDLEAEARLHVFPLEQDATAQAFGQPRQGFERGLDGHVVDGSVQDTGQIIEVFVHGVIGRELNRGRLNVRRARPPPPTTGTRRRRPRSAGGFGHRAGRRWGNRTDWVRRDWRPA